MPKKSHRARRASILKKIRPGTPRSHTPGAELHCLVLAKSAEEWVGVDLSSGALVRNRSRELNNAALQAGAVFDVLSVTVLADEEPADPARPEAITIGAVSASERRPRRHAIRKLLKRLAAPEVANTPVVSMRGPSVAYVDLDGSTPSVVLISVSRTFEVMVDREDHVVASLYWAGTTHLIPVVDPAVCAVARHAAPRSLSGTALMKDLGFKPTHALVGLAEVRGGHAKKVVLGLLGL